jgi:hypothetical protein
MAEVGEVVGNYLNRRIGLLSILDFWGGRQLTEIANAIHSTVRGKLLLPLLVSGVAALQEAS